MKRIVLLSAVALAACTACNGQKKPTDVETTYGSCSPNMAHNAGSVTINCRGLDPAVAAQIAQLVTQMSALNKKTATEKNQQAMMRTLKQMQASLEGALAEPANQIIQNSTGYCSPNIVGSNNTNVCGPQNLEISSEQSAELTRLASGISMNSPVGQINVKVEIQNHQTQTAGFALSAALQNAGLNAKLQTSVFYIYQGDNYGGITFEDLSELSLPAARAIAGILLQLGIVHGPIPFFMSPDANSADFTILVKTPQ